MLKQKTVYFREEDLPLWEKIENKAEWLHDCLSGSAGLVVETPRQTQVKRNPASAVGQVCKNGHPLDDRGKCFGKGCKYS